MENIESLVADQLKHVNEQREKQIKDRVRELVLSILELTETVKETEIRITDYKKELKELKSPEIAVVEL